jgi:hypothetical protein
MPRSAVCAVIRIADLDWTQPPVPMSSPVVRARDAGS